MGKSYATRSQGTSAIRVDGTQMLTTQHPPSPKSEGDSSRGPRRPTG